MNPTQDFRTSALNKEMIELMSNDEPLSCCRFCSVNEHRERRYLVCFDWDYRPKIAREWIEKRIMDRWMDLKELQWEMRSIENSAGQVADEQAAEIAVAKTL